MVHGTTELVHERMDNNHTSSAWCQATTKRKYKQTMADSIALLISLSCWRKIYSTNKNSWVTKRTRKSIYSPSPPLKNSQNRSSKCYWILKSNSCVSSHTPCPNKFPINLALSESTKMQHIRFSFPSKFQNWALSGISNRIAAISSPRPPKT